MRTRELARVVNSKAGTVLYVRALMRLWTSFFSNTQAHNTIRSNCVLTSTLALSFCSSGWYVSIMYLAFLKAHTNVLYHDANDDQVNVYVSHVITVT
jgi:hypothetical protein